MPQHSAATVTRICVIGKTDALSLAETFPCTHKAEVAASDIRPITLGDTSSLPAELGAGQVTVYPAHKAADLAAEAGKLRARTPVKKTLNARPRARIRTKE